MVVFVGGVGVAGFGTLPEFPFGFGLSYTRFEYSNLQLNESELSIEQELEVTVDVTNVGVRAGDEVVQLYASRPSAHAPRRLCGFGRLSLAAGQTLRLVMRVSGRDLANYDVAAKDFRLRAESCTLIVGRHAHDCALIADGRNGQRGLS